MAVGTARRQRKEITNKEESGVKKFIWIVRSFFASLHLDTRWRLTYYTKSTEPFHPRLHPFCNHNIRMVKLLIVIFTIHRCRRLVPIDCIILISSSISLSISRSVILKLNKFSTGAHNKINKDHYHYKIVIVNVVGKCLKQRERREKHKWERVH